MKMHPEIRAVRLADHAKHERRPADERDNARRHHPIHRRSGDVNAVLDAVDDATLVRNEPADQVFSHARLTDTSNSSGSRRHLACCWGFGTLPRLWARRASRLPLCTPYVTSVERRTVWHTRG